MRTCRKSGFTILELLMVVAIIAILAALVLSTVGYVNRKGATSRAQAELAAIETALESYKADQGEYPRFTASANPEEKTTPPKEPAAYLTAYLCGKAALRDEGVDDETRKREEKAMAPFTVYYEPNKSSLSKSSMAIDVTLVRPDNGEEVTVKVRCFMDPFGEPYGYTASSKFNSTGFYDLWSRSGTTNQAAWIKSW